VLFLCAVLGTAFPPSSTRHENKTDEPKADRPLFYMSFLSVV